MKNYVFNISLSILNHLGRNLYRSFITVLGEAISNSWDADAKNVYITIDRQKGELIIRDDGNGMTEDDFQNKFLTIGYSKRKDKQFQTISGRPYIGRKGIGKLALLSCAKTITVLSKTEENIIIGGIIDNSGLDQAIKDDLTSNEYNLGIPSEQVISKYSDKLGTKGTIIIFEELKDEIRNKEDYIRKLVALYFRFSLKDESFNIYLNDVLITIEELKPLLEKTQFVWKINNIDDPYVNGMVFKKEKHVSSNKKIKGFIASVEKPSNLKIKNTEERVSIDLYVNGRLREKDILRHISTARIVENYLYGQIHYDEMDDEKDRFTSSREGVVPDDPKFKQLLDDLSKIVNGIIEDWDVWRSEIKQDGDLENPRLTNKARKAQEFFNVITEDFLPPKDNDESRKKVEAWVNEISEDATYNFTSYGECFVCENLLRKFIADKNIAIHKKAQEDIEKYRNMAEKAKKEANINFDIREDESNLSFLNMNMLALCADREPDKNKEATLLRNAIDYKPIRDALAHTARLTKKAKQRLDIICENVKMRVVKLLSKA